MSKLGFSTLLTTANAKIAKSNASGKGYWSALQHLAPAKVSGFNVCPQASPGCIAACLNTAGRGIYQKTQDARIARTLLFINDRTTYLAVLRKEIAKFVKMCEKDKTKPAIRLNGTSDIKWEEIDPALFTDFKSVQFYDYTKITKRMLRWCDGKLPANYHLTFSRSEKNGKECISVLKAGGNVAVVFKPYPPCNWNNCRVIDGDLHDQRFLDPHNVVVGLKAKGKGRRDISGFVVELPRD